MKCKDCGKPLKLIPSARQRARKYGGKPAQYARTIYGITGYRCTTCYIAYRNEPKPAD